MLSRHAKSVMGERLKLAEQGIYTFLAHGIDDLQECDCDVSGCKRPGKHPRFRGKKRGATINKDVIKREKRHAHANVALHPGLSRLVILDIDPRNGGLKTMERLEHRHGPIESFVIVDTGGGGEHRYFREEEGVTYPSSLGPGVDVLSGSKYPIIPPSRHHSGGQYRWREGCDLIEGVMFLTLFPKKVLIKEQPSAGPTESAELAETETEVSRLRSALESIPADCSRNEWRDILYSIKSTGWNIAEELARGWSQTAPELWSQEAFDSIWQDAKPIREGGRTTGSIYYLAKRNGWLDPYAKTYSATLGDIDNGQRFAASNRGKLIYDRASKTWREYCNGIWRLCQTGQEEVAAKAVAEENLRQAGEDLSTNASDASKASYMQALRVHRSAARITALIDMAKAESGMSVSDPAEFDRDPLMLGVEGGAVDLRTGEWIEPSPTNMISKSVGARFDQDADCPRWREFISEVFANEGEEKFVQRFAGYSLTGLVDEEVFLFMQGSGANGKSVMANVLSAVFGEYAVTVGSELLAVTKNESEANRYKVRLCGARLALVNEVGQNDTFNDQRVKEVVSREAISARMLYGEAFDYFPTHKLWVRGNHRPAILDSGDGMWRRVILLPFCRQFSPSERIHDIDRKLFNEEGSGILNWCIEGCLQWQKQGLSPPSSITRETAQYRDDTDVIGEWLETECELRSDARCSTQTIFASYQDHCRKIGMHPKSRTSFVRMIKTRGFRHQKSNGKAYLLGIDVGANDL